MIGRSLLHTIINLYFMKKRYIGYALLPVLALALVAGTASAHGFGMMGSSANPQEIATAQSTMFQKQADILGISVEDVKASWAKGQSLQDLAKEKGISEEQLKTKMQSMHVQQAKDHLQALVTSGVITQAQADQRLQFMQTQMKNGKLGGGHRGTLGHGTWF